MTRILVLAFILSIIPAILPAAEIPPPPAKYRGMLPNGKPFVSTMYYERYYNYPAEYGLMDRDLADIASRGWTVAYTDYTHLSLGEVWDHYYETAQRLGLYVLPDQWNACFHAGGPFFSRIKLPITETGKGPTGFAIGAAVRFKDSSFVDAMVEYQSQVLTRYINHPAYPKILGPDGKMHPVMVVIYETGMADYDGHWIDYSLDTIESWREWQKKRLGKVFAEEPPKPSELDKWQALVLWNDFRAEYIAEGWGAVARGLKQKFPDLYAMVAFRQHGLLEGSKSGVEEGGIGRRAIRPELWADFDIICDEHDGDDGINYLLADADLMKSASAGKMGALIYYLDSGYKSWSARPVEFHRPWGQSEMLGSMSLRGLLPLHYGYNERDDRAGIASTGRREKDAPLWQAKACEEASAANKVFMEVAPYLYAAKPVPAKAAIVMPYEGYSIHNADELALDKRLVAIWTEFHKRDIPVDWVFSSAKSIPAYKILVVPEAPYSNGFRKLFEDAKAKGTLVVRLPLPGKDNEDLKGLNITFMAMSKGLSSSRFPPKPGVETGLLLGAGYEISVIVNHSDKPVTYPSISAGKAFPSTALKDKKLTVPAHSSVYWLKASSK